MVTLKHKGKKINCNKIYFLGNSFYNSAPMDDFVTLHKTPAQYKNLLAQTENASLLKLLQLKINKKPTEITSPDTLSLNSKEVVSSNKENKNQDGLGQWRKAELKRRDEVMHHEVMRPSTTFSEAAELGGICYLGSVLLFPHLGS